MRYLDYAATCPLDDRVFDAMKPHWRCGNPASSHVQGKRADAAVTKARAQVATSIGASPSEVVFTSGATEADNWALKGYAARMPQGRIVTQATEHKAVLNSLDAVNCDRVVLPVSPDGTIDLDQLRSVVSSGDLVSIMAVNNETGVRQPVGEVAAICRDAGAFFHSDATQALGKIPIRAHDFDLLSISAHKVYGPKGVGALYIRDGLELEPMFHGGRQEAGRRAGTTSVPLVVGFGHAVTLFSEGERDRIAALSRFLVERVGLPVNGQHTVPGIVSFSVPGVEQDELLRRVGKTLCCSAGSACQEGPSHVMEAMGVRGAVLRVCVGRQTTRRDIVEVATVLGEFR